MIFSVDSPSPRITEEIGLVDSISKRELGMPYKLPLVFEPQPEGGYTVTSPLLPELITEGDTFEDAVENVQDALAAVIEFYDEEGPTIAARIGNRGVVRQLGLTRNGFTAA